MNININNHSQECECITCIGELEGKEPCCFCDPLDIRCDSYVRRKNWCKKYKINIDEV